jgi:hypothetical protein
VKGYLFYIIYERWKSMKNWYNLEPQEVLKELSSDAANGLATEEAAKKYRLMAETNLRNKRKNPF